MARTYFKHSTSIWRDDDFRNLAPDQQALYFLIGGQSEITAAGTVPLRPQRWARMARTWTVDRIMAELAALEAQGHVVVDENTEEVLVVKFVKWDQGYTNETKRLPVIRDTAMDIESPKLRRALAVELRKLGLSDMASELAPDSPSDTQPDRQSDTQPGSDRLRVTEVGNEPYSLNPSPETLHREPVASPTPTTAQTIVREYVDRNNKRPPDRVIGQVAKLVGEMLSEGIDADDIRRGLSAWMTKGLHPSTLPSVVNEVMNAPNSRPGNGRKRDTDDKVRDGLALAQRLMAGEEEPTITGKPRQIGA